MSVTNLKRRDRFSPKGKSIRMNAPMGMMKLLSVLWLTACLLLSLGGVALFVFLFVPHMSLFELIISPVILAVYQFPAVILFRLWKGWRRRRLPPPAEADDPGKSTPEE
jgi:hypothetical protein